jgi:hypothetical protein
MLATEAADLRTLGSPGRAAYFAFIELAPALNEVIAIPMLDYIGFYSLTMPADVWQ